MTSRYAPAEALPPMISCRHAGRERYLDEEKAERSRWQSLPFGGGPRVCIGINFAYMEATYVLGLMLSRHHLELDPDWELKPAYVFNVILDGGLPVTVSRR